MNARTDFERLAENARVSNAEDAYDRCLHHYLTDEPETQAGRLAFAKRIIRFDDPQDGIKEADARALVIADQNSKRDPEEVAAEKLARFMKWRLQGEVATLKRYGHNLDPTSAKSALAQTWRRQ